MEIESGFEYVKQADEENNLSFVLTYGIVKNLDLGIEIPYKFIDFAESGQADGLGDISLVTKYRFLEEDERLPAVAVSLTIKTDTGNEDDSLGDWRDRLWLTRNLY